MDMSEKLLELSNVSCGYGTRTVVQNVSFSLAKGEILCFLGPNGVGKTTLFKAILGFIKTTSGSIRIDGRDIAKWNRKTLAKAVAFVPQVHRPVFPFSVLDMVIMGRTAHVSAFGSPGKQDMKIAVAMLERLNIAELRDKAYTEISGGQQQLVLIARALAQQAKILIMDEPTASLDYGNQIKVLEQVKSLAGEGIAVIMTTHFPDHAFLCATKVALMQADRVFEIGEVAEIVTEQSLGAAYGIRVKITHTLSGDGEWVSGCIPLLGKRELTAS
ncbi:MAG: ABC transporter ATP-binding protein [Peptococcaceae bacterium]|nr:ABC transporter ATP-binding protein [Peptococcaceae bacterium]